MVSERTDSPIPSTDPLAARTAALEKKEKELQTALATIRAAFRILGGKLLVFMSLLASIAAFGWACYQQTAYSVIGATIFTAMTFWPSLWMEAKGG